MTKMFYDAIVVGAGPAGTMAARYLAQKGVNVAILDKEEFPRDKPCGGGLTYRVLKRFPELQPSIERLILNQPHGMHFYFPDLSDITYTYDEPIVISLVSEIPHSAIHWHDHSMVHLLYGLEGFGYGWVFPKQDYNIIVKTVAKHEGMKKAFTDYFMGKTRYRDLKRSLIVHFLPQYLKLQIAKVFRSLPFLGGKDHFR